MMDLFSLQLLSESNQLNISALISHLKNIPRKEHEPLQIFEKEMQKLRELPLK